MTPTAQVKKVKIDKSDNIKIKLCIKRQKSEKVTYGI